MKKTRLKCRLCNKSFLATNQSRVLMEKSRNGFLCKECKYIVHKEECKLRSRFKKKIVKLSFREVYKLKTGKNI